MSDFFIKMLFSVKSQISPHFMVIFLAIIIAISGNLICSLTSASNSHPLAAITLYF